MEDMGGPIMKSYHNINVFGMGRTLPPKNVSPARVSSVLT